MEAGLAVGVQELALLRPVAGVHEQDTPPDPVNVVDCPAGIVAEPVATAVGSAFTVTVTVGLLVDGWLCWSRTVRVYVVVEPGLAIGVHEDASFNPVAGDQEQETPPEPVSGADPPAQTAADPDATAVGGGMSATVRVIFAKS